MKMIIALMIFFSLQVSARTHAQKINISRHNATLEEVLGDIHQQTGYYFLYGNKALEKIKGISVDIHEASLAEALDKCISANSLGYSIQDKIIIVFPKKPEAEKAAAAPVVFVVRGTVTDNQGNPLQGATVRIKNTNLGTMTDADGHFQLEVSASQHILQITYLGYEMKEVSADRPSSLKVTLEPNASDLNEVVVLGYTTEKKSDLTGAVGTVNMQETANRPTADLSQSLQGLVPGLTVERNSGGVPGSSGTLIIRGFTSVNSSGPLVLINGVPGSIDNINPGDIASISVLKDASSTAIYGARAAEGVVLITTKNGNYNQPLAITYNTNVSLQTAGRFPAENGSVANAILGNLAYTNSGAAPLYTQEQINLYTKDSVTAYPNANNTDYVYVANTNWEKLLFKNSFQQSQELAISGGAPNIAYRVSGGLLNEDGMFAHYGPDNFQRKTFRANLSAKLIPSKLKMDLGIDYFNSPTQNPSPGYAYLINTIQTIGSNIPVYNPDGSYARYKQQQNPIQLLTQAGFDDVNTNQITGRMNLEWDVTKGLSVTAIGAYMLIYSNETVWDRAYNKTIPTGIANTGYINNPNSVTLNNDYTKYNTEQLLINYDKIIATNHHLHLLVGGSIEQETLTTLSAFRNNIEGNELPALNLGSDADWSNNSTDNDWAIVSGFSRLNYDYKDKYLLEANTRIDGSSRFSEQHRWGTFPSVSAAWKISSEPFMKAQHILSNAKLRVSWGETGNQDGLGYYDYVPVYNISGYYPFGGGNLGQWTVSPELASQDRTWETVVIKNAGVDLGFLKNRLAFTADYFEKKNKNMLIGIQVPATIGITVPTGNYGVLLTKGWETSADWKDNISKTFGYSISVNLANQNDKLINYGTGFAKPTSGIIDLQGYPLNSLFGYQAAGYFQTTAQVNESATQNPGVTAPGDIKYVDQDKDGKISAPNDLIYMGNTTPHYTFGVHLGLSYKNFDFVTFLQGVGKRTFYLDGTALQPFAQTYNNYSFKIQNNYWTATNPNALFPRPYLGSQNYSTYSTHWLQNAAYVRLKNVQLGYSVPADWCKRIRATRIRIYISGDDLAVRTKMIMYDPEINTTTGEGYPVPKRYSAGLNVDF